MQRGTGEPGYFVSNDFHTAGNSSQYNPEPRIRSPAKHQASSNIENMASTSDHTASKDPDVSPELIAAITERVKRELVEHLKQTGNVEEPIFQRASSNKSSSTSSPPPTAHRDGVYTPPSPTQSSRPIQAVVQEPLRSPPSSPLDKPSGVRFSDRTLPTRPGGLRTYSTLDLSAVDEKWGRLFDRDGNPTQRLGQFLRGIANHLIEDFPPKKTIVVTPTKMAAYYASHAVDSEKHPLVSIFRAQNEQQISKLYIDLGCQFMLVQETTSLPPTIPALTAVGFAHWATLHILAYPDQEAQRLEKVVLSLPIDSDEMIEGKPERLPKQISRHLLPEKEDRKSRQLVENAISNFFNDLGTSSRRKASITSPSLSRHSSTSQSRSRPVVETVIHQARTSPTASKAQPIERERNPYSGAPTSESSGNEEIKIERDRQPYTAQPGNGKVYNENAGLNTAPRLSRANSTNEPKETRHHRAQSNASQNFVPAPRSKRRPSSPPIRGFSISTPESLDTGGVRLGMPPSSATSAQSQPFGQSSYSTSSSIPPPPPPIESRRARDYGRRGTDEEARVTSEFVSPRDAERWDKFQETRDTERSDRSYEKRASVSGERGSVSVDPREIRGAAYEDWYRDPPKGGGTGHDGYTRY